MSLPASAIASGWSTYQKYIRGIVLNKLGNVNDISHWRNEIFLNILIYITPLSIIALVPGVIMSFMNGLPLVGSADLLVFFLLLVILLSRSLKLQTRKIIFIGILYFLSIVLIYFLGKMGPGLLFLLALTVLSSIIYSSFAGYYSAWGNTFICFVFGLTFYFGGGIGETIDYSPGTWIAVASNLILLSFVCAKCLKILIDGLSSTLSEKKLYEDKLIKTSRLYQFISEINQSIVHIKDEKTLFRKSCQVAYDLGKFKMAWIGNFNANLTSIHLIDQNGIPENKIHLFNAAFEEKGPQYYVLQSDSYYVCNDIANDLELTNWKPFAALYGINSCIVLPITKEGRTIGTFNLYATDVDFFDEEEIRLLVEATGDISFALDVYERERKHTKAEALIIKNEIRFRSLIENSTDMKTLATADGILTYASPSVTNLLGYEIQEFLSISAFDLIHPEDISGLIIKIKESIRHPGSSFKSQHRILHKDGSWRWCDGSISNLLEDKNINALVSNFRDITEKKEAEILLTNSFAELEIISNEQEAILNTLPAIIALVDKNGEIVKVNDQWNKFGYENGLATDYNSIGKNYIEISAFATGYDKEDGMRMANGMKDILNARINNFSLEYTCNSDEEKRWFKAEISPFKTNNTIGAVVMHLNITDRKKEEEEMLLLLDNTTESFIMLNENLFIISFNKQAGSLYKSLYGVDLKKGSDILEYADSGRKDFLVMLYHDVLKGETKESEIKINVNKNEFRSFLIRYAPSKDELGNIKGVFVTASDITQKKKFEEQKEFEKRDKEALINSTDDLIWSVTDDYKLIAANNAFITNMYESSNILLKPGDNLMNEKCFSEEFLAFWKEIYKRALKGESFKSEIFTEDTNHRQAIWIETSFNPIYKKDKVVGIACYARNTTERRIAEEELKHSEANLKEAQAIAHLGSWQMNFKDNILHFSNEGSRIFENLPEQNQIAFENWVKLIHSEDLDLFLQKMNDAKENLTNSSYEFRIILKDKSIRHIYAESKFNFDNNKKPTGLFGIMQDITERKLAETEREKMISSIILHSKNLEQFTSIVSHNLRAPVANILGLSSLLKDNLSKEETKSIQQHLFTATENLDDVFKDLNKILQIRSEINEHKEQLYFQEIVDIIQSSINNLIIKEEVKIITNFKKLNAMTLIKSYVHSIFYNLILNSIKYRRIDKAPIIKIESKEVNGKIVISFKDNGLGVDLNKYGEKIFGLYKRFHLNKEGKGLGLFMVKTQVESLGGSISVKSNEGEGAEFIVEFPM